jgi:hypothetical protein
LIDKAAKYGFGRIEVAPVYSNGDAIQKYLTKQDWQFEHWPFVETKSFQFWRCSRSLRCGPMKFSWNSRGSRLYRERLQAWAEKNGCPSVDKLQTVIGKKWGWYFYCELQREAQREQLYARQDSPPLPPPPPLQST